MPADPSAIRVLLVEDDKLSAKLAQAFLAKLPGFSVHVVHNAEDALAYVRGDHGKQISIVLADNALPGVSGIDLAKQIRADASLSHLAIAIMTASEASALEGKAKAAGANVFVTKAQFSDNPAGAIRQIIDAMKSMRQAA